MDRDKVDYVDPNLGAVSDAKCGEVHTRYIHDYARQGRQKLISNLANLQFHFWIPSFRSKQKNISMYKKNTCIQNRIFL